MIRLFLILVAAATCQVASGQVAYWDFNPRAQHSINRLLLLNSDTIRPHSSIRYQDPIRYSAVFHNSISTDEYREDVDYLSNTYRGIDNQNDSVTGLNIWNTFYKDRYHFFTLKKEAFSLLIDPMINISIGSEDGRAIFQNTRGLKVSGSIDNKVYFYSSLYENQRSFLSYINRRISRWNHLPGQGFYKSYNSGIINSFKGWDYLNAQAYVGFKISRSIDFQLGYSNNFIGDGYRSLLLSDYSHNYFHVKLNTQIWKFHYQNIFAELSPISSLDNPGDNLLPKKYMAAHYLDFMITPKISLGLYEAVIFSRANHFEFQYLNPLILYRTVEQFLDSPDNVLIGLNLSIILNKKTQAYSQLMVDEFRGDQLFSGTGWWGNKLAYQLGIKHFDLFKIKNLDFQLEFNAARPFTYTHRSTQEEEYVVTSYSHFNQALAHPLGANFKELITIVKYQINQKWFFNLRNVLSQYGDSRSNNIGFDILLDYETRQSDFDNYIGQGNKTNVSLQNFELSYQFYPNYYIDFEYLRRNQKTDQQSVTINYWGIGVRANMTNQKLDY